MIVASPARGRLQAWPRPINVSQIAIPADFEDGNGPDARPQVVFAPARRQRPAPFYPRAAAPPSMADFSLGLRM
jgi:hypothetical protein